MGRKNNVFRMSISKTLLYLQRVLRDRGYGRIWPCKKIIFRSPTFACNNKKKYPKNSGALMSGTRGETRGCGMKLKKPRNRLCRFWKGIFFKKGGFILYHCEKKKYRRCSTHQEKKAEGRETVVLSTATKTKCTKRWEWELVMRGEKYSLKSQI